MHITKNTLHMYLMDHRIQIHSFYLFGYMIRQFLRYSTCGYFYGRHVYKFIWGPPFFFHFFKRSPKQLGRHEAFLYELWAEVLENT